jgi:DNA-binding transcriptional LysR family regulator
MELRHLRYFVAVGEILNFTKAAVRVRVAQPALSRQMRDLEEEIGADPLARLESIPVEKLTAEPIVDLHIGGYRGYLDRIFACTGLKPRMAIECDTYGSALIEVEAGRGITFCAPICKLPDDKRVLYRRLTGTTESLSARIARAKKGHVTPAGEEFCDILRNLSNGATAAEPDPQDFSSFLQSSFI